MSTLGKVQKRRPRNPSTWSGEEPRPRSLHSRSVAASVGRSTMSEERDIRPNSKWLGPREYLLLLVEAAMSLAAYVIRERNLTETELARHKLSYRATEISMLHYEGYSALISMFVGCMVDSYFLYHTVALLTVILHFGIVCLVVMVYAINLGLDKEDYPYEDLMMNVCIAGLVLIKSTDFSRLVYGLEGMITRRRSTICSFIFLHFWVSSSATYGGVFVNFFVGLFNFDFIVVVVSFVLCGLSLFLFVIFLISETEMNEHQSLGCQVISCLFRATFCRACTTNIRGRRGFFGRMEGAYTKMTILKAKELLVLYGFLLSTLGISFGVTLREDIFFDLHKIKLVDFPLGLTAFFRTTKLLSMLLAYFILWPSLAAFMGCWKRKTLTIKYLLGHTLAILALLYIAIWMKTVEQYPYATGVGYVRIFNTAKKPAHFVHADEFSEHDFQVGSKEGIMLSFPCSRVTLFPVTVGLKGEKNLTMFLSVAPGQLTGYIVVDPLRVIRIRGFIPLREGPPGTNKESKPRLYIFNTAETLSHAIITIKLIKERKAFEELSIEPGVTTTISLEPSTYDFGIPKAGIKIRSTLLDGGVYGLMVYTVKTVRAMSIDTVMDANNASPWGLLGFYIPAGLGLGLAYPSLRAIVFFVVPQGLTGMGFAFLAFLEGLCLWISYIGFTTWHTYVSSTTLFLYASAMAGFFLLNLFLSVKLKNDFP